MRPESIHSGHRLGWPGLAVLFLVPLLAVGMLLGLVRDRNNQGIHAAVVNHDKAVTVNGQVLPLGRQLASEMVAREGTNISWTIADEEDAAAGLREGRYSAVVTIPEGFSEAATSFSSNDADIAKQATVDVSVSENSPLADAALAHEIAGLATDTINSTLTKGYLENIYVGFNRVGEQFKMVVDGAGKLNQAGSQLADGASSAAENSGKLVDGLGQLSTQGQKLGSAANTLADGSQRLANGAGILANGSRSLAGGTQTFAEGIAQLNAQAPKLVDGVNKLTDGATPLLKGIPGYTSGTVSVLDGVSELRGGLAQLESSLNAQLDPEAMKEAQAALGELVPVLREAQSALKQYVPGAGDITIEEVRSKLEAFDAQLNKLDSTLAGYASGETPPPSELKEFSQRLVGNWKCPVEDPQTCKLLREAYQQGVGDAMTRGFQQGAKAALGVLQRTDPKSGKTLLETARGFSRMGLGMTESIIKLRTPLSRVVPAGTDPLTALEKLPSQLSNSARGLTPSSPRPSRFARMPSSSTPVPRSCWVGCSSSRPRPLGCPPPRPVWLRGRRGSSPARRSWRMPPAGSPRVRGSCPRELGSWRTAPAGMCRVSVRQPTGRGNSPRVCCGWAPGPGNSPRVSGPSTTSSPRPRASFPTTATPTATSCPRW